MDVDPKRISVLSALKQFADLTAKQAHRAIQTAEQAKADYQTAFDDVCERCGVSSDEFDINITERKLIAKVQPAADQIASTLPDNG